MAWAVGFVKNQIDENDLTHFTVNELSGYVADAYEYLATQVCREVPGYWVKVGDSTAVASGDSYVDLPVDAVGCIHSVEILIDVDWFPLSVGSRRRPVFFSTVTGVPCEFSMFGHDQVRLYPTPDKGEQVRFTYPYVPTVPVPDGEGAYDQTFEFEFPRGYERLIPMRAILDCGFKEKSEVQHGMTLLQRYGRLEMKMMAYVNPSQEWEKGRVSRKRG
jgi:hypothetical protein